jgi:hypothetical protein
MTVELSLAARDCCARWFGMTPNSELHSHEPHATLSKHRSAIDELLAAGIITEQPFNQYGSILFKASERSVEIGRARMQEISREQGW